MKTGRYILVVDDDDGARGIIRRILEAAGFSVVEAESGTTAMQQLVAHAREPALVLIDGDLPAMSGAELIAVMKSYTRLAKLPIVVVSAAGPHPEAEDVVHNPFDAAALLLAVRRVAAAGPANAQDRLTKVS